MDKELRAVDILTKENKEANQWLTPSAFKKKYGNTFEIKYFLEDSEPRDLIARQQAVLQLAKDTGGWVFTGIHKENDWSRTAWWASGWHLANRTGEYAVVIDPRFLPSVVTGPASLKRYGKAMNAVRKHKKQSPSGFGGLR